MKRFVVIYKGQAFPVRSKSMEKVRTDILNAYAKQDGNEEVRVGNLSMVSSDIANGNYLIFTVDEWFENEKGDVTAPFIATH